MSHKSLNKVYLLGIVEDDPLINKTTGGTPVANFTLRTTRFWEVHGEKRSHQTQHTCVAWDRVALIVGKFVLRGSQVLVEGRIENQRYKDPQGVERQQMEIMLNDVIVL